MKRDRAACGQFHQPRYTVSLYLALLSEQAYDEACGTQFQCVFNVITHGEKLVVGEDEVAGAWAHEHVNWCCHMLERRLEQAAARGDAAFAERRTELDAISPAGLCCCAGLKSLGTEFKFALHGQAYSASTALFRLRGLSTSMPFWIAMQYEKICSGMTSQMASSPSLASSTVIV
jgi:hypothetical protein